MAISLDLPPGVRSISSLAHGAFGEEASDLTRLMVAGVPIVSGWLVNLGGERPDERLHAAIERAAISGEVVRLRPLFPSRAASDRFARVAATTDDLLRSGDWTARIEALVAALQDPESRSAFGGRYTTLDMRVFGAEATPSGRAASADPERGDPDELSVWGRGAASIPWRIDRRSARVEHPGQGLDVALAESAADLADRVQLALGRPVEIEWVSQGGRLALASVRPLALRPRFAAGSWSRLALVAADEGTVAPLAIDALDRALGAEETGPQVGQAVRRIYARPYRRWAEELEPLGRAEPARLPSAAAKAAGVAADIAPVLASALRFERSYEEILDLQRDLDLTSLDDEEALEALADRQRIVAEALLLLDLCRGATRDMLGALEAVVGPLPRECYPALAAPRAVRARRRLYDKLVRLAKRIEEEKGALVGVDALSEDTRRRWHELRGELAGLRPLGIDVTPEPIGFSDETMREALSRAPVFGHGARERARRDAVRRVLATARTRSLGRARGAFAGSLTLLLGRIARAKGGVGEGVSEALLALREAALEIGARLVRMAVLDRPEDAFYLTRSELEEALRREPGAYAARVRLRREDDMRWASFDAPRRLGRGS